MQLLWERWGIEQPSYSIREANNVGVFVTYLLLIFVLLLILIVQSTVTYYMCYDLFYSLCFGGISSLMRR